MDQPNGVAAAPLSDLLKWWMGARHQQETSWAKALKRREGQKSNDHRWDGPVRGAAKWRRWTTSVEEDKKKKKKKKEKEEEEEETRLGLPTHQGVRAGHVAGHPSGEEEEDELEQFCFSLLCLTIRFYPRALGIKGETDNVCWGRAERWEKAGRGENVC